MADGDDDIFVYMGEEVPGGVTHAVIDPSVNIVRRRAFHYRRHLVSVIFHDGVEIVEEEAFFGCESLSGRINLLGVREIGVRAFCDCFAVSGVEFGDKLETIGIQAFSGCSMRNIESLSVRTVQKWAFSHCEQLTDVEFGIDLESIGIGSFYNCPRLRRIAIPLKENLFPLDPPNQQYNQFGHRENLRTVDIVGAEDIQNTISSLLLGSWRDEVKTEFDRINRELLRSHHSDEKAELIRLWIRSVINTLNHYKAEHNRLLKEHMTQLELAVWKAKLDEKDDRSIEEGRAKKAKIDSTSARSEQRITSGADIVVKNVIPFLQLAE